MTLNAQPRPPRLTDDEADARIDAIANGMGEIAGAIADMPAESIAGVLLKLETSDAIVAQDEDYGPGRMILTAIEDLRRMAGLTAD